MWNACHPVPRNGASYYLHCISCMTCNRSEAESLRDISDRTVALTDDERNIIYEAKKALTQVTHAAYKEGFEEGIMYASLPRREPAAPPQNDVPRLFAVAPVPHIVQPQFDATAAAEPPDVLPPIGVPIVTAQGPQFGQPPNPLPQVVEDAMWTPPPVDDPFWGPPPPGFPVKLEQRSPGAEENVRDDQVAHGSGLGRGIRASRPGAEENVRDDQVAHGLGLGRGIRARRPNQQTCCRHHDIQAILLKLNESKD